MFVNPYKELLEEEAKAEEAKRKQVGRGTAGLAPGPACRAHGRPCANGAEPAPGVARAAGPKRQLAGTRPWACQQQQRRHAGCCRRRERQGRAGRARPSFWAAVVAIAVPILTPLPLPLAPATPALPVKAQAEKEQQGYANDDEFGRWWSNPASAAGGGDGGSGVGRYLSAAPKAGGAEAAPAPAAKKARTAPGGGYGNFDAW